MELLLSITHHLIALRMYVERMALSHYFNEFWLLISHVLWHSHEGNFSANTRNIDKCNMFENKSFKITSTSHGGQWVNNLLTSTVIMPAYFIDHWIHIGTAPEVLNHNGLPSTMAQEMLNQYCIKLWCITNIHNETVDCVLRSVTSIVMETELLNLVVLRLEYSAKNLSISWLLLPWFLASPGHQKARYWQNRINESLPFIRVNFNNLHYVMRNDKKNIYFYVSPNRFST